MRHDDHKCIELGKVFDRGQLDAILRIGNDPARVTREVIEPAMTQINERTGQENDARYWGYMICAILEQAGAWKNPAATLEDLAKLTRGLN